MIEFEAKPFIDLQEVLVQLSILIHSRDNRFHPTISTTHKDNLRGFVLEILPQLEALDLRICITASERLLDAIDRTSYTNEIIVDIEYLRRQIIDHIGTIHCLSLNESDKSLYYPKNHLFGEDVEIAFPQLSEDISEAGKCLALGRFTACVFHLMRAMEASLFTLCVKIGANHVNKHGDTLEWGVMLTNINDQIKKMPQGKIKDEWSEATTLLYHVKQAWRNSTMHPKQSYSKEEAITVFNAVKSFIVNLSNMS